MPFTIEVLQGYIKLHVVRRGEPQQGHAIGQALLAELARSGVNKVLAVVAESDPIFQVEQYKLSELLKGAAAIPGLRIALVSDTAELQASHQYVELLAGQRGVEVRSFRDEEQGLRWLTAPPRAG